MRDLFASSGRLISFRSWLAGARPLLEGARRLWRPWRVPAGRAEQQPGLASNQVIPFLRRICAWSLRRTGTFDGRRSAGIVTVLLTHPLARVRVPRSRTVGVDTAASPADRAR